MAEHPEQPVAPTDTPSRGESPGAEDAVTLEDARRRFLLALRAMTVRKSRDERASEAILSWEKVLREEVAQYRRQRRRARLMRTARMLFFLGIGVLWITRGQTGIPFWLILMIAFGGGAAELKTANQRQSATALARTRDPRALNALAIAYRDGDPDTRQVCEQGLRSILGSVRASDAVHLSDEGLAALLGILHYRDMRYALKVAVLKGLEQIGDGRAIPAVQRMLNPSGVAPLGLRVLRRFGVVPSDPYESVVEAARACLPYLEERAEAQRQRERLLRPATAPTGQSDHLLRPAGSDSTPEEQLLRPFETT